MKTLCDRALILLHLVDADTQKDWTTGELSSYFVPKKQTGHSYYLNFRGKQLTTDISTGGDASALRGLERRGLIKRPKGCNLPQRYCYEITEEGRKVLADNWQLFEEPARPVEPEETENET